MKGIEGNSSAGGMMQRTSHGLLDLEGSMHMNHPQHLHTPLRQFHLPMQDVCPSQAHFALECRRPKPVVSPAVYYKGNCAKTSTTTTSDEDDPSFNSEDGIDGHYETGKGKKGSPWHRVKWTDGMVRLLITAVSYTGEDIASECHNGMKRKSAILQKKGKWKSISKVMAERDCCVSPQQCEDKFNDLNKRYTRLTDILGRGTSCKVVENPAFLNLMGHLSDKAKDDARKILSSKHLFYEEMCSYHNGNRLHLPADPALLQSLQVALRSREDHDTMRTLPEDVEDGHNADTDNREYDTEEYSTLQRDSGISCFPKRMKQGVNYEKVFFVTPPASHDYNRRPPPQGISVDMNQVMPEGSNTDWGKKQWMRSHSLQLEEQRLQIQAQMLELEQQRFKWQQFSMEKYKELENMRMENEEMKLENEQLVLELNRKI